MFFLFKISKERGSGQMDKSRRRGSWWVEAFRNKYFDRLYAGTIYPANDQVVPESISMVSLEISGETSSETLSRKFEPLWISGREDYDTGNGRQSRWNNTLGIRPEQLKRDKKSVRPPWFYYMSGKRSIRHKERRLTMGELLWQFEQPVRLSALAVYDHQAGSFIPRSLEGAKRFGDPEKMVLKLRDHLRIEKDFLRLEANA